MTGGVGDLFLIAGLLIVAAVAGQGVWLTYDLVRRGRQSAAARRRQLDLLDRRLAAIDRQERREAARAHAWAGWRKFEIVRKQAEDRAREVCSLYLAPHDRKAIAPFDPGQYLTFRLSLPGQTRPVVRCYSLSDASRDDHYRVTIKRCQPPSDKPDAPPGVASCFFVDKASEGAIVDVQAPRGNFFLDQTVESPVVLIGGGIGVTPLIAMLEAIAASGGARETWLFYGVRNTPELIMRERLDEIAAACPHVRVRICFSRPRDDERRGIDYHHEGHVTADLLKQELPSNNYDFFICGPGAMMSAMTEGLRAWGVPPEQIHTEAFGPASVKKSKKTLETDGASGPQIVFRRSGKTLNWTPQAEHIWELADAHEIRIDAGCLEGSCGSCVTAILSGRVRYDKQPAFPCEEGTCLPCCCVPTGPLELDA